MEAEIRTACLSACLRGNAKGLYLPSCHAHVTWPARYGCKTPSLTQGKRRPMKLCWYDATDSKTDMRTMVQWGLFESPSE